jgi:4-hydroxy-2-oxoheptanedioate aldolase
VTEVIRIAAVDGIDLLFVGPGDLAVSLGVPFGDERVVEAALFVLETARAAGRATGVWAPTAAGARSWFELGFQLVLVGSDLSLLAEGVERLLADLSS